MRLGDGVDTKPAPSPLLKRLGLVGENQEDAAPVEGLEYVRARVKDHHNSHVRVMVTVRARSSGWVTLRSLMRQHEKIISIHCNRARPSCRVDPVVSNPRYRYGLARATELCTRTPVVTMRPASDQDCN